VEIFATYDTSKLVTSPPYEQYYEPLAETHVFSRKVCLYKLTKQADATLTFDMCSSNKCECKGRLGAGAGAGSATHPPHLHRFAGCAAGVSCVDAGAAAAKAAAAGAARRPLLYVRRLSPHRRPPLPPPGPPQSP
jgi:hypothetical protein